MNTKRLFLVGCPRSGTTLLQSMVASHSSIVSFPETHFFSGTLPINPLLRKLRLYGPESQSQINQFLDQNGYAQLNPFSKTNSYSYFTHKNWCRQLIEILDRMIAFEAPQKNRIDYIWGLEKTPRHLHYISSIEQAETKNKFLHILRDGPDVVASLHLATKEYPEEWDGQRSVRKCIKWWNNSIKTSLEYREDPNHLFVVYGQLLKSPEKILRSVCSFLDLDYQELMIKDFPETADSLTQKNEHWKRKNQEQSLTASSKLEKYFDNSTIAYIHQKTLDIDLEQFYQ